MQNNTLRVIAFLAFITLGTAFGLQPGLRAQDPSPLPTPSPSPTVPSESPSPLPSPSPLESPSPSASPLPTASPSPSPSEVPLASPSPLPSESPSPSASPVEAPAPDYSETIDKTELHQALIDLTSPWTVMCVAAHPDDEDGTTLTVLRRKQGVHTVSLFSTYGEGGQNAIGPELYEELGVIRSRETARASTIQGSEPYFLGLRDFGFSKSAEETFRVWGQNEALRRMVLKIRELRPDVIITNHDTSRGHGHHQATGQLILEAFDAAADPNRFPEQLQRVTIWQPQRLFVRLRTASGSRNAAPSPTPEEKVVTIDPNERDFARGTTYAEQALTALQEHASQGPWPKTIAERLAAIGNTDGRLPVIRYAIAREVSGAPALPANATSVIDGLTLDDSIRSRLVPPRVEERPLTDFVDMPDRVLDALIAWRRSHPSADMVAEHSHRARLIRERGNRALALTARVSLSINSRSSVLVPGTMSSFTVNLSNAGNRRVRIDRLSLDAWGATTPLEATEVLPAETETTSTADRVIPPTTQISVPPADHLYDGRLFGDPLSADAELDIEGAKFSVNAIMRREIAPAIQISKVSPSPCVLTLETIGECKVFSLTLTNHLTTPFRGHIKTTIHSEITTEQAQPLSLGPNETREETVTAALPAGHTIGKLNKSVLVLFAIHSTDSDTGITQKAVNVVFSDARVPRGLRVGYVPSFDETLKRSLAALGVDARQLTIEDIQKSELGDYDTVVIDNRGYQAHPELIAANSQLLSFVRKGGTMLVFYHKDNEWNPDERKNRPQLAPYPIILGDERVTEETAPVVFLQRGHPLMNLPNKIRVTDFDGWIQERGLYYPKEWDRRYQALFSTSDAGEQPLRGGLLATRHGRGYYIYTSMVWYRQLAAGVPGAYRVFANLISYGHWQPRRTRRLP